MIYRVIPCFLHVPVDSGSSVISCLQSNARDHDAILMADSQNSDRETDYIVKNRTSFEALPEFKY